MVDRVTSDFQRHDGGGRRQTVSGAGCRVGCDKSFEFLKNCKRIKILQVVRELKVSVTLNLVLFCKLISI